MGRGVIQAAKDAPPPPLLPPGTRVLSQGFVVLKKAEFSVEPPIANSSMFVLPMRTASASLSFRTTVASYGGTKFSSILLPQVVFCPLVQITSLIATGNPP